LCTPLRGSAEACVSEQAAPVRPGRLHTTAADVPLWLGTGPSAVSGTRLRTAGLWVGARAASDVAALVIAVSVSGISAPNRLGTGWTIVLVAATILMFAFAGLYVPRMRLQIGEELRRLLAVSALACVAVAGIALGNPARAGTGDVAIITWLVSSTLLCTSRVALFGAQRIARRRAGTGTRTIILGAGEVGHLTAKRLLDDPQLGMRPVGFLDKEPMIEDADLEVRGLPRLPVLGASWDLERIVAEHGIEQVVVAFSTAPNRVMVDMVRRCWALGVSVLVVPRLYEIEGRRMQVQHIGALPLVSLRSTDPRGVLFASKYAIDRVVAALALLLLSPLVLPIAVAVLVTMGRPLFFRQQRVGRDGTVFEMIKFRTMRGAPEQAGEADAKWAAHALGAGGAELPPVAAEDRRTPLGAWLRRLSLDELPQLWNVVRGEMSLVGPRPERAHYVEQFEQAIYRYPDRHRVKSGLTGWAQIHGLRGETSLADRIEWDNFYIENWSHWLDLKILLLTIPAILGRRGGQ
jgi:exopolysaccharide biosynthesis polyprenyl glycosylphosphotransferase